MKDFWNKIKDFWNGSNKNKSIIIVSIVILLYIISTLIIIPVQANKISNLKEENKKLEETVSSFDEYVKQLNKIDGIRNYEDWNNYWGDK